MIVLKVSYGNDSVALIQWAFENGLDLTDDVFTLYNDTGWAHPSWGARVEKCEAFVASIGFTPARTKSIGLKDLVAAKKGWPRQGIQFCTEHLKILPTIRWLDEHDPGKTAISYVGVRREESENRRNFPEVVENDHASGGRTLRAPLVLHTEPMRDALLARAGFEPLPHRSDECFPCINSNRADLRRLNEMPARIDEIETIETAMGFTAKGAPRTMFRPYRYMGATGIREIVRWANSERGAFTVDDGTGHDCDSGLCGG